MSFRPHGLPSVLLLGLLCGPVLAEPATGVPGVRRALVVAYNGSDAPGMPPLRYADDDGVRWAETLRRLGVDVVLLTVPDADTEELERERLNGVRAPTVAALDEAVSTLSRRNAADRAAGRAVDFLFVYVGHGRTGEAGRAYLTLADGQLDQDGLYTRVVERLDADYVHLLVDACHAAGVVGSRGGDPLVLRRLRRALEQERLAGHPRVGAVFAESDEGETHEWSRLRAGVFSHAARSALLGGADVNADGRVEYSELDAFVASAIRGVKSPRARLTVRTFPPALSPTRALVGPAPEGPRLKLPASGAGARISVEDTLGVRLVDAHRTAGEPLVLALPERDAYWLRMPGGEARVRRADLEASRLPEPRPPEVARRGAAEESLLQGLFALPFGRDFYEGYVTSAGVPAVDFSAPPPATELPGVARALGLDVGLTLGAAPLDGRGVARGLALSWRAPGPVGPSRWGVRASYSLTPDAWVDTATLQRVSVLALGGVGGRGALAPFAEVGAGWLLLVVNKPGRREGDAAGLTARAATGLRWKAGDFALRGAVGLDLDGVRVDGRRRWTWAPGVEVGLER
ncbi:caspase family protein [Pyxidicoccus xibeiensis]|uniref:caspase family protein n=1 Tax=Pyxidicoccus xibeiensis TaxID=2906759 RepID=UPI0020A83078|nr:caspase family protein [Pyxidicoccus xibeiensis]MCP3136583.1 caspase family protein [Pyxidicoccus xibeiensis]